MNKELLEKKAERYSNAVGDDEYDAFLAGAKEILDNPELYELVQGSKYEDLERILSNNEKVVDAANRIIERLKQENKELKEEIEKLKAEVKRLVFPFNLIHY